MVKQTIVLLVISVLLGTVFAGGVAEVANGYFHTTLDSLVGSYGEYDFIVQVQEEKKDEAKARLETVLTESFGGGSYQEAPALGGRANFFVAIPTERKNKAVYERIDSYFAVLPGAAGLSIISEPRLSIRGVPSGATDLVIEEAEKMDGVRFAFVDGSTIQVMLSDMEQSRQIEEAVEMLLARYRVLEIRFPQDREADSPVRLGDELARNLRQEGEGWVKYVSLHEKGGEEASLVETLTEMRSFLEQYRSRVTIFADEDVDLAEGEYVQIDVKERPIVCIERIAGRQASGVIVSGDAFEAEDAPIVYRTAEEGTVRVGTAQIDNPRIALQKLMSALTDAASFLPTNSDADKIDKLETVLSQYEKIAPEVVRAAEKMEAISPLLGAVRSSASMQNTESLTGELNKAIASLDNTRRWLNLAAWASEDIREAKSSLEDVTKRMTSLNRYLTEADTHARRIDELAQATAYGADTVRQMRDALTGIDIGAVQEILREVKQRMNGMDSGDASSLVMRLKDVATTLPAMRDDDLYRSIRMIDRFVSGYLIPNKRIQLLTNQTIERDKAEKIVYDTVGHTDVSVSDGVLGVIEPNTYLQVYRMLYEVKRILAGLVAVLVTGLFLAVDHTSTISMLKMRGAQGTLMRAMPYGYAAIVGSVMLASIFYLAGAAIPYVPFFVVPIFGAIGGMIVARYSERINPISQGEIMAADTLGMSDSEILREIVIPSGRPGLVQILNRRTLRFK